MDALENYPNDVVAGLLHNTEELPFLKLATFGKCAEGGRIQIHKNIKVD